MPELSADLESRLGALEARMFSISRFSLDRASGDTNGCTNCGTNACTNCVANELMNVLLPGEERALSGREIVGMLAGARKSG